jgi:hypothetical protein
MDVILPANIGGPQCIGIIYFLIEYYAVRLEIALMVACWALNAEKSSLSSPIPWSFITSDWSRINP